jgi:Raf kinase inhibitor-like YbhB/YbcL family protein
MTLALSSKVFAQGQAIPAHCTGDGRDVSPSLEWRDPPQGTVSFALICDDPDAPRGTFTHWLLFNLPAQVKELAEGVPAEATLPNGAAQGKNDFGKSGYGGPAPPPGKPHRYYFKLFALERRLDLKPGSTKAQLQKAMEGHILAEAALMGIYGRQK